MTNNFTCPVCGYLTFSEKPGSYQICVICFWEDDVAQLRFPNSTGANSVSLLEAQQNYINFGASEQRFKSLVAHNDSHSKDSKWRVIDLAKDHIEEVIPDKEYSDSYPADFTDLYYWNK